LPHAGVGDGCLHAGPTLHHPQPQGRHLRQRHPGGLESRTGHGQRRLATALGRAVCPSARGYARRLDGHRAGGSRRVRPLVVSYHYGHGLASIPAHQSAGPVSPGRCDRRSAAHAGGQQSVVRSGADESRVSQPANARWTAPCWRAGTPPLPNPG
jgi:hypothetical protein